MNELNRAWVGYKWKSTDRLVVEKGGQRVSQPRITMWMVVWSLALGDLVTVGEVWHYPVLVGMYHFEHYSNFDDFQYKGDGRGGMARTTAKTAWEALRLRMATMRRHQ